ncbi:MAG TPA: GDSL-type esterase/lipase family protein [Candidatus Binatia bacterium]|jgi:lysophospholipase L1-like esterase|nr:GDSL-type esterase/lipase family protein [Candidatus Binatia bacterium]
MKSSFTLRFLLIALLFLPGGVTPRAQDKPPAAQLAGHFQIPATDDGLPGEGPIRRYDWFRKLWTERRTAWAGRGERDRNAVVLLGDSITQGWGEDFSAWFPGMRLANRGISGDTSRGVLIRLQEDVLALDPRAVVLLIGTNDLEEKANPETAAANLKLILAELARHEPKIPVVLCQVFPSSASKSRPADKIKKLNQLYGAAVKGNAQVTLLETWLLFADARGDALAAEFPDLLHPNLAGYAKWAAALRPIFATLGFLETQPYQFTPEPGFVSLFNGKDLTGWGFRPTSDADKEAARKWRAGDPNAPPWPIVTTQVSFDGQTSSSDGRFIASNGRLIVTTPSEGRKIQQLSTTRDFPKDFILRLEFRATPNADSGIFIRNPQLQCRDYLLAGPYKNLRNYRPGDWNEIEVIVTDGMANCLCNGEVLEAAMKVPPTGPIGLEGDRGQMEYRRIRIKETP